MFGSTAQKPASGGFSFGGSTPAPAASTGGFSFGGAATSTAPAAGGSTGFSFGGTTTPAATPATSSSFSFGGTSAAAPASSGFSFGGSSAAPAASTTSSFGFGASNTTTKPPLFGQTPTGTSTAATGFGSSGFGFGSTTTAPATTTTSTTGFGFGSSFGATKPTTTGTTGFSFGSSTGITGFGSTTGTGGFGTTPTTGFGSFGTTPAAGTTPGALGAAPAASTAPAPIILATDPSVAQLNTVKSAYQDPMQSRFKFLMYNTVDPTQRHLYTRPAHISERLWNQAELDNPDPLNCAPVPLLGFQDLLKRIKAQQEHADKYNQFTDDLRAQLNEMEKHTRATEEKLDKCRHEHVQLFHALVKVMKDIEFLQNLGKPLQREEMQMAQALKKLQTLLDSPGQYKARLNDAVALQRVQKQAPPTPNSQFSPQDLQRLYEFLDKQRQGLEHLTTILNDDLADIQLIKETWRR